MIKYGLFSNLSYESLMQLYIDAMALLIPLTGSIRDTARFPHKICEYLASGNPMITTNYGEIPYYFRAEENALIADKFEVNSFSEQMQFVIDNPQQAARIGEEGKKTGRKYFHYQSYGEQLTSMIEHLSKYRNN